MADKVTAGGDMGMSGGDTVHGVSSYGDAADMSPQGDVVDVSSYGDALSNMSPGGDTANDVSMKGDTVDVSKGHLAGNTSPEITKL